MPGRLKHVLLRLYAKMLREKAPPAYVARGWALGMFIGCSVPFGFQLAVSIPLSFVFKASKVGATLGTLITNPLTIFIIYPAQTWVADRLFLSGNLSYARLAGMEWTFETVMGLGVEAFEAFILGGLLLALLLTPLTYWGVLKSVTRYRARGRGGRKGSPARREEEAT